jgi:hypothetical protein
MRTFAKKTKNVLDLGGGMPLTCIIQVVKYWGEMAFLRESERV